MPKFTLQYSIKVAGKDYGDTQAMPLDCVLNSASDAASLIYRAMTGKTLKRRRNDWHCFSLKAGESRLVLVGSDKVITHTVDFKMIMAPVASAKLEG